MNQPLLRIDEAAARGAAPADLLAVQTIDRNPASGEPAWAAVGALGLGVFSLVTAEFLPASLLTPIAADFKISEGAAGQTVSATAIFALLSSLFVTAVIRNLDRRTLMLGFTILLLISNLIAAFALNFPMLLIGRVLLGAALGGFWTMSAALTMRLVPEESVPRALSIIFSGVSAATIFAAPLGIYMGHLFGWRAVFLMAAGLSAITLIAQAATLPRMPSLGSARLGTLVEVLRRHGVAVGMICAMLVFIGHFAFFTYLRPFLEFTTGAGVAMISGVLLGFGVANLIGHDALRLHAGAQSSGDTRVHAPRDGYHLRVSRDVQQLRWDWISRSSHCGEWRSAPCPSPGRPGSPAPFPTKRKVQGVCSSRPSNSPYGWSGRRRRDL